MSDTVGGSWYGDNSTRNYPLADGPVIADNGQAVPSDLFSDLMLVVPDTLSGIGLLGLTVGPQIITAVFGTTSQPVAAITAMRPIAVGVPYTVSALVDNVGGWGVFASGVESLSEIAQYKFQTPLPVCPRALRYYPAPPVTSIGKVGSTTKLRGIVRLSAGNDLEIVAAQRQIEGVTRTVAVIRLSTSVDVQAGRNLASIYKGPCGGRPESETCVRPAIEQIGEATPDCNGNIDLMFGAPFDADAVSGGIKVNLPYGLGEACPKKPFEDSEVPGDQSDVCPSETVDDTFDRSMSYSSGIGGGC